RADVPELKNNRAATPTQDVARERDVGIARPTVKTWAVLNLRAERTHRIPIRAEGRSDETRPERKWDAQAPCLPQAMPHRHFRHDSSLVEATGQMSNSSNAQ